MKITRKDIRRFWSKVGIKGEDDCWLWKASCLDPKWKYGQFWLKSLGRCIGAHTFSLILKLRRIIKFPKCSLHTCDNPQCVNPKHLFLGTKGTNNSDRKSKGRNANRTGENNTQAKMTASKIIKIRKLFKKGRSKTELSRMYKLNWMTIHSIVTRRTWKHLP